MIINLTDIENAPVRHNAAGTPYKSIRKGNARVVIVLSTAPDAKPDRKANSCICCNKGTGTWKCPACISKCGGDTCSWKCEECGKVQTLRECAGCNERLCRACRAEHNA